MQIEASVFEDFFKIPRSEKKTTYSKRSDVKTKLEEISMFCIDDSLGWDTDTEQDSLMEEFFKYLFDTNSLQGMDGMINAKIFVEFIEAIENEFSIEIDVEAKIDNIETLTNHICSKLKIKK